MQLVDEAWRVKVSDFNLSKILQDKEEGSQNSTGGVTNPTWLVSVRPALAYLHA